MQGLFRLSSLLNSWSDVNWVFGFQKEDSYLFCTSCLCVVGQADMGMSLQVSLPVYCHFKLALLVCIGLSALGACPAQGEHGCLKTSPFLEGGIHSLPECLFTCTFTLWVNKHLTWGKCKSLSSARCSAPLEIFPGIWLWHCKGKFLS